ncbi:thiolase family protein [Amycolatopsis endophytica]|uniref:propanoyl-CoA C-acyltransferase n=1 Tax=Amycolatopsis endophytica TaxID=860233 RepID=A0A853B2T5_9PSEU|nr:thiolase family protein [Amycolatopsis endophytica]NYI89329.1 acetyl-CoA acetyltransferase [Amycolatopsis endophytica]
MTDVVIAGAAMTRFGKFGGSTIRSLSEEAVSDALADAGLTPAEVGMVFFANAAAGMLTGQEMIRGQVALRHTGLLGAPIVNVENACASASTAFHLAVTAVAGGAVDVALAVGVEKLTHHDKTKSFAAIATAVDQLEPGELRQWTDTECAGRGSLFMDIYAAQTRAYMARTGATAADFAEVSVKSHDHASLNPKAQYRERVTAGEVLASRLVSEPLTVLMCSPLGDGAAAIVVCSAARARALGVSGVRVRGCALVSGDGEKGSLQRAATRAFNSAGLGPEDLDVLEIHDAAAPAELMVYEDLGLCGEGQGAALLRSGQTRLGGSCVVNPSGGLLAKGHPIGATGCGQLVELTDQLRGRCGPRQVPGARVALAENGGGFLGRDTAAMVVTILAT